jgi:hypothetical protein
MYQPTKISSFALFKHSVIKTLSAVALVAFSQLTLADSKACNFSTDYNIDINDERVVFSQTDGDSFEFKPDQLLVNGESVKLNHEQSHAATKLHNGARAMLPKIAEIAVEGAELGVKATTMVLTSLFGDDDEVMQKDLIQPIEALSLKIKQNINQNQLNTEALETSFEQAFDQEFENMIANAASKYSGKLLSNVMDMIFSADSEELKDFEFRMENLEKEMEEYVEANAKQIEVKAKALCQDMVDLEQFDRTLQSVAGYPAKGLFNNNGDSGFKLSDLSFN